MPTACSTIEEVGSTGVGALTVAFVIFAVCAVVFLAKANTSGEQRKCVICHVVVAHVSGGGRAQNRDLHPECAAQAMGLN